MASSVDWRVERSQLLPPFSRLHQSSNEPRPRFWNISEKSWNLAKCLVWEFSLPTENVACFRNTIRKDNGTKRKSKWNDTKVKMNEKKDRGRFPLSRCQMGRQNIGHMLWNASLIIISYRLGGFFVVEIQESFVSRYQYYYYYYYYYWNAYCKNSSVCRLPLSSLISWIIFIEGQFIVVAK